jgi:hypothetical protein
MPRLRDALGYARICGCYGVPQATTVVPGSHRLTFDPRNAFLMVDGFDELATATTTTAADAAAAAQKAAEHVDPYYHVQPQSAMPNPFKFAVNAGDVCLFDTTYVMTLLSCALLQQHGYISMDFC